MSIYCFIGTYNWKWISRRLPLRVAVSVNERNSEQWIVNSEQLTVKSGLVTGDWYCTMGTIIALTCHLCFTCPLFLLFLHRYNQNWMVRSPANNSDFRVHSSKQVVETVASASSSHSKFTQFHWRNKNLPNGAFESICTYRFNTIYLIILFMVHFLPSLIFEFVANATSVGICISGVSSFTLSALQKQLKWQVRRTQTEVSAKSWKCSLSAFNLILY